MDQNLNIGDGLRDGPSVAAKKFDSISPLFAGLSPWNCSDSELFKSWFRLLRKNGMTCIKENLTS